MARLPVVGADDDQYGALLNEFLRVSHKADGTLKDGLGMNPGQVAAIEATIARLTTQQYDIRDYAVNGEVGTSDDSDAFIAAVDDIKANGGGKLTGPLAYYTFLKGWELADYVFLEFPRGTVFDVSGIAPGNRVNGVGIYGGGSITPLPDIAVQADVDSYTLTFASDPGLATDDEILFYNSANYSFSPASPEYRDGERTRVLTASGTTVTTTTDRMSTYPTTVDMYKVHPIHTGISGVHVVGGTGFTSVLIKWGANLRLQDYTGTGSDYSNLTLDKCYVVSLSRVYCVDYSPAIGLNYGMVIANCQDVYGDHQYLETTRHGLTTGGDAQVGCIPNRNIHFTHSFINGISELGGVAGCNVHGNIERYSFHHCTMPHGFNPAGDKGKVTHCEISSNRSGNIIHNGSLLGADFEFTHNRFIATRNYTVDAFFRMFWTLTGLTRTGGTFKCSHNVFELGDYTAASGATSVIQAYATAGSDLPADNNVEMRFNEFRSTAVPSGAIMNAINLRAGVGRSFRRVIITDNTGPLGIYVNDVSPEFLDLSRNTMLDCLWNGLRASWPASPVYPSCLFVIDGGTIMNAQDIGLLVDGRSHDITLLINGLTSLNCNQRGDSAVTQGSMRIFRVPYVKRTNCTLGDTQAVPTQTRLDSIDTVTTFKDRDNEVLGSVTTRHLNAITTHVYHGEGTAAPALTCADGSSYHQIGVGSFDRKGGAWVAVA